jgi:hypothetical protein
MHRYPIASLCYIPKGGHYVLSGAVPTLEKGRRRTAEALHQTGLQKIIVTNEIPTRPNFENSYSWIPWHFVFSLTDDKVAYSRQPKHVSTFDDIIRSTVHPKVDIPQQT